MVEVNVIRSITDTEIYQVTQVYHSVVVLFSLQMRRQSNQGNKDKEKILFLSLVFGCVVLVS